MEDTLKGTLVVLTIISLFITAILNFIVLFPQEQGVTFSDSGQQAYLTANTTAISNSVATTTQLNTINNQTTTAFNQWDITQGFMGSNTVKQTANTGISGYSSNIFHTLSILATQIFSSGSPVLYVITILSVLTTGYLVYQVIQFVRTGR